MDAGAGAGALLPIAGEEAAGAGIVLEADAALDDMAGCAVEGLAGDAAVLGVDGVAAGVFEFELLSLGLLQPPNTAAKAAAVAIKAMVFMSLSWKTAG